MTTHETLHNARRASLRPYLPNEFNSPDGNFFENGYIPFSYKFGQFTCQDMERHLGFSFTEAGIKVVTQPYEVAEAKALLGEVLSSNMDSSIPHYFITLTPPKSKSGIPAYCARTIINNEGDHRKDPRTLEWKYIASILDEIGATVSIDFMDHPPYCTFPSEEYINSRHEAPQLFRNGIQRQLIPPHDYVDDQDISLLAGIGKSTNKIVQGAFKNPEEHIEEVANGSAVITLARLAMILGDQGLDPPIRSHFIISTTRLTNELGVIPQAYLLDRMFKSLGMKPEWLGMAVVRAGAVREHPTGAVLVEIKPEQHEEILGNIRTAFKAAVQKMMKLNPQLF